MNRPYLRAALVLLIVLLSSCLKAEESRLTLLSLNLHYLSLRNPELLDWDERKASVAEVLASTQADLIALQETETFDGGSYSARNLQLEYLLAAMPEYEAVAIGDPAEYPSTQPILIRRNRFELMDQGFFFYSPTPDEIYSRSWDGRFPAFTSWVRLLDRESGMRFYLYNLHLDAGSASNRDKAVDLNLARIAAREETADPVIIAGDFNAFSFFPSLRKFRRAGFKLAPPAGPTFHFNRGINLLPAIDHLLYKGHLRHLETRVIRQNPGGIWPSDHYPLLVVLSN